MLVQVNNPDNVLSIIEWD